jgi:rhodanese-related sulfurtransferase
MKTIYIILLCLILGFLGGILAYIVANKLNYSSDELIKEYYYIENAVHVSPHSLRVKMDRGIEDYILVDLRSPEEYEKEHIIGAINIPAYIDPYTPSYDEKRIVEEFSKLPKNKEIIVYCYSTPCMTGRKVGFLLAKNGIFVKHLNIGWNEWRYHWQDWNHEIEWNNTKVENYIYSGKDPGRPQKRDFVSVCGIDGGC